MKAHTLHGVDSRLQDKLKEDCFDSGILKAMPAAYYAQFDQVQLSAFCVSNALYCLPTLELLDELNRLILEVSPSRNAIEIGAGNGAIGKALGIHATDSYMQTRPEIQMYYQSLRQPTIAYGSHVENLDANAAVERYRPDVVVGAWVTHLFDSSAEWRGGNAFGIDEGAILSKVKRYIVIGNRQVHDKKPILDRVTRVIEADYLFSRSAGASDQNAIFIWDTQE
jgi:hypothetical protein